jgi:hypothetical protein
MSTSKHLDKIGIIGLLVVAPLCLEICEVAKSLEILGISFSTARGMSIVLLGLFLGFSLTGIMSAYHSTTGMDSGARIFKLSIHRVF